MQTQTKLVFTACCAAPKWPKNNLFQSVEDVKEERVEGSGYGTLCGSAGSESVLVRVRAGRDVVFEPVSQSTSSAYCRIKSNI